jgi:DNA-binding transcriptional MerR regulator
MEELLDIGEVARRTGKAPSALRFYERKGLIRSVDRRGLRRLFEPSVVDRVAMIVAGQDAGFGLDELRLVVDGDRSGPEVRRMFERKAVEIDERIERLADVSARLRHAAGCPTTDVLECPVLLGCVRAVLPGYSAEPAADDHHCDTTAPAPA